MGLYPPVQKPKTNCTKLSEPQTILCLTKKKEQNNSKLIPTFFKKADQINLSYCEKIYLVKLVTLSSTMLILQVWWNKTPGTQIVKQQ